MTPLRILYLSHEYPPAPLGGIGVYTRSMAHSMAARGHDVHVLVCNPGSPSVDEDDDGVWVHRRSTHLARLKRSRRGDSIVAGLSTALSCSLELQRLGPEFDVIEAPDHLGEGWLIAKGRTPMAVCLHDGQRAVRGSRPMDRLEESAIRRADMIRSPSRKVARALIESGGSDQDRVRVLPVPIDLSDWPAVDGSPERPRILVPGNLEIFKAPEVALQAAALLSREIDDLEIIFVGRSVGHRSSLSYGTWIERAAEIFGVDCQVKGLVRHEDMAFNYSSASVVALPSVGDNMPMVALEGLACGRPVVSTTGSGAAEVIEAAGAGRVVPPHDPPAFARALKPFLEDGREMTQAGKAGRSYIERAFAPELVTRAAEDFYRTTIERA